MKVGIVGLPNAGKSSLFNALTRAGAEAANYPFTTVEPNVAVVPVPDERLDAVVETVAATPTVYETIEFHDIAGLVRGAHKGEGLGNKFLANIRETDALVHVVRAHGDEQVIHPEGRVDPLGDVETVETELLFADLEQAERRLDKVAKEAKGGERDKVAEKEWVEALVAALQEGRPARTVPVPEDAPDALRNLSPLTAKPVLYLANVDEGSADAGPAGALAPPSELVAHAEALDARAAAVSARLESELGELDDEEAATMRADLGVAESGLATVVREAWKLLGLISFFTAGEGKEGRAWAIREGTSARRAAGKIHTDIEKGFVAAEVIGWRELVELGGYAAARDRGKLRVEGREYVVADGDVMTVRFTP
ncbi:MAG TPA: redox-regulated ATPase YchF [Thermoleophilaceae bacterium]|nr:redox-regulated ATPase YchF [Thermoleophilaceae bacterium]